MGKKDKKKDKKKDDSNTDTTNGYGSSLTPPQINIDCNLEDVMKFPLIGSFFQTILYTVATPLLFVLFLLPVIVALSITIQSCKTITFDTFRNMQFISEKMIEPSYYAPIIFIVVSITFAQIILIFKEDYFIFSLLGIMLFIGSIIIYIVNNPISP